MQTPTHTTLKIEPTEMLYRKLRELEPSLLAELTRRDAKIEAFMNLMDPRERAYLAENLSAVA